MFRFSTLWVILDRKLDIVCTLEWFSGKIKKIKETQEILYKSNFYTAEQYPIVHLFFKTYNLMVKSRSTTFSIKTHNNLFRQY